MLKKKYKNLVIIVVAITLGVATVFSSFLINKRKSIDNRSKATTSIVPIGSIDLINVTTIAGWAKDPDNDKPIQIHVYIDNVLIDTFIASGYRPDVGSHAFNWVHSPLGAGQHTIVLYGIGIDLNGNIDGSNSSIGEAQTVNDGCNGLTGSAYGWCRDLGQYWVTRQQDTKVLWNDNIKVGINNSLGGTITQFYSNDRSLNLIEEHGGAAMQLSIWGYESSNPGSGAWFGINKKDSNNQIVSAQDPKRYISIYECQQALLAGQNPEQSPSNQYDPNKKFRGPNVTCVERGAAYGPHVAGFGKVEKCDGVNNCYDPSSPYRVKQCIGSNDPLCNNVGSINNWEAGAPFNPIQAQGINGSWAETSNDVTTQSEIPNGWVITKHNPYNFTKTNAFDGLTWSQKVELGDAFAKVSYTIDVDANAPYGLGYHPQEIPAIFTSEGTANKFYYFNGANPYIDSASANGVVEIPRSTAGRGIMLTNYNRSGKLTDQATENWWGSCDTSELHCLTFATFSQDIDAASLNPAGNSGAYLTAGGYTSFPKGSHHQFSLYMFPYKWNKVINGKSIRQRIFDFYHISTPDNSPLGSFDGINSSGTAYGWSLDKDNTNLSNNVHFYLDGPAGSGTFIGSTTANLPRSDINSLGYPGNHGFNFNIPNQYRDGKQHTLYAHGINLTNTSGTNVLLSGSPKTFNIPVPTSTPIPTKITTFTPTRTPTPTVISHRIDGDLNGDKKVNILDLSELATNWGKIYLTSVPLSQRYGDVNGDFKVDILDLSKIAINWGKTW